MDLYRGKQGTCPVLLASTATLTHSSTGISLLKCQNAWIAYLSSPCPSFERKMPKHQSFNNSKAILPRRREQRLLQESGTATPRVATRGCERATPSPPSKGWSRFPARHHSEILRKYKKKKRRSVSIVPHQLICKTAAETTCFQFISGALPHKFMERSVLSALSTRAA